MAGLVLCRPLGFEAQFPLGGSAEHVDGRDSSQVGLYATEQEAQRVVDLLRLKEALDSGAPLQQVPLYLSLQEYMGNDSTMQYLRDHDMRTVWATFHACGAHQLQSTAGGGSALPMPLGSGAAAMAITPRSTARTARTAGVLTGRNWWEQLSEVEDEEAESGDGVIHEACRGDDREGEAGWVTELDSGDEAAASEGAHSGAEGASRRHPSQRHASGSPAAVSHGGQALDREQSVEHSVRPRRAAALRNKQVVAAATAAAELEEARRQRAAATAAAALQRAQQEEARRRQQLAAAQQAQQRVAQQAQQQQPAQQQPAQQGAQQSAHGATQQSAQQSQSPPRQQQERPGQEDCEEEDGMVDGEQGMPYRKRAKTKTIIFPPVPASMKCGQCVNCQNPQRKRPCVLARRRLLELLREQEAAAADAEEAALEAGEADAARNGGKSLPASPAAAMPRGGSGGACALRTATSGGGFGSSELSDGLDVSATPKSPAAAIRSALNLPSRKQLYPVIPPTERCGRCKPCLNPKLKKACREARQRQLEAGVAPPLAQLQYNAVRAGGSPLGSPTAAAAAAAAAAAGASGRPRVPQSAAMAAAVAAGRQLGASVIGCRIRIYWGGMRRWYEGRVGGYDAQSGQHHIEYDDGDQQEHVLGEEKFILLDPPRALPAGQAAGEAAGEAPGQAVEAGDDDEGGAERPPPAKRLREDGQGAGEMQAQQQQQAQQQGECGGSQGTQHKRGGGGGSVPAAPCELAPGGSGASAPETPAAAAAHAALPLLVQSTPVGPAAAAAAEAVMQLPAALALLCRRGSGMAAAASEAGVSGVLVGRFMAAFSCRMSQGQRQEHAAFLLPLIQGECYEGVQACLQEALLLCPKPQDRTTTFGSAPAALPGGASPESTQRAPHKHPAAAYPPDSSAVGTTGGGTSTSGSGSDGAAAAAEHAVAAGTQTT